jgi:hypothetical protein
MANSLDLIEYKKTLKLTEEQHEILIGTLLGDATIPKQKNNTLYNIKFEQKAANKEYVDHLYGIFKPWVGTEPKIREIRGGGAKDRQSIWFRTYRHSAFTFYYNEFYRDGKKVVPKLVHRYLTPRSLAYWFMDDGGRAKSEYRLSSHAFSHSDNEMLKLALIQLGLTGTNLRKDGSHVYLAILTGSCRKFEELVQPFILPCMKYKLISKY